MIVKLTAEQLEIINGMNKNYWQEVSKREDMRQKKAIGFHELNNVTEHVSPLDILLILGEYAKNYKP